MIWNSFVFCLCGAVIAELAWQLVEKKRELREKTIRLQENEGKIMRQGDKIVELELEVERLTNPAPCFENRQFKVEKIEIKRKVDVRQILRVDPIGQYVNVEAAKKQIIDEAMTQVRKEVLERADVNLVAMEDHNGIITVRGRLYVAHEVRI